MIGQDEFERIERKLGNKYAATMAVAKEARRRAKKSKESILESHSITWVLTGKEPTRPDSHINKIKRKLESVEDILNYVSDRRIVKSVTESIGMSKSEGHLIYRYKSSLTDEDRTRVRILTNIIWYRNMEGW